MLTLHCWPTTRKGGLWALLHTSHGAVLLLLLLLLLPCRLALHGVGGAPRWSYRDEVSLDHRRC